jgi:RimJ/RimL family protein N-acetyltransferase
MFIRSERLFLRLAWPEDAADLHHALSDERIVRNLAQVPWPYTIEDARAFIRRPAERRFPSLLITKPSQRGSRLIGGIGLHDEDGCAQLGCWLVPEAWGQGYATEAARAMLGVARILDHARIGARHFLDNPASGRVLEKAGFRRSGRVNQRFSLGRGCSAPSREYVLCLEGAFECAGPDPLDEWDARAA